MKLYFNEKFIGPIAAHFRDQIYRWQYEDAAPDQYKLITVDTKDIDRMLCRPNSHRVWHGTYIKGGQWDVNKSDQTLYYHNDFENAFDEPTVIDLENFVFYQSVRSRIQDGVSWEQTEFYQWITENTGLIPYYKDESLIHDRLNMIDTLCHSIQEHGYQTQRQLQDEDDVAFKVRTDPCPEYHEVVVEIGRDGQFLFEEGRHRFCVAKALGIEIPVRVFVRHKEWQEQRMEALNQRKKMTETNIKNGYVGHPDVETNGFTD